MRKVAGSRAAIVLCLTLASFGCGPGEKSGADARHYEVRGIVRDFSPDRQTIDIEHEAVPGFMPSMTMPFILKNSAESAEFRPGDAISFRLAVTEKDSWIDHITRIDAAEVKLPAKPGRAPSVDRSLRLRAGDAIPPFELTDQNGQPIKLETFHGRPFVLTFIFTRCPIPNFCPRMSQNFAELQKAIQTSPGALGATRLLSVSFDPKFDTPEVLKQYAGHQGADPAIWTFATGELAEVEKLTKAFSILVQPESGTISHSLATALIDRDGNVTKIWRGNGWNPAEVMQEVARHEK